MEFSLAAARADTLAAFLHQHERFLDSLTYTAQRDADPESLYGDTTWCSLYVSSSLLSVDFTCYGPKASELMADICREFGGRWDKDAGGAYFKLTQERDGLTLTVDTERKNVCTPRVVGQRTKTVPDYKNAPTKEVTEDVIEWDCAPSLLSLTKQGGSYQ